MGNGCIFWAIKQINLIQIYMNIARILEKLNVFKVQKGCKKKVHKSSVFCQTGRGEGGIFDCSEHTKEQTFMESVVMFDFQKEAGQ